jgi:hypothetical protein
MFIDFLSKIKLIFFMFKVSLHFDFERLNFYLRSLVNFDKYFLNMAIQSIWYFFDYKTF